MADRTILLAENGRYSLRGIKAVSPQEFMAYQEDNDALTYTLDYSNYLGSDTISSVARQSSGVTVTNTSNTTTQVIQRLKGFGYIDITTTFAGGDVNKLRITIRERQNSNVNDLSWQ